MTLVERREREKAQRRQLILSTARTLAEKSGWDAVTTRALADLIEYSQPVLYQHFRSRDDLVVAVAQQGFAELSMAMHEGRRGSPGGLRGVIEAYLAFAAANPRLYEAMFVLPTDLRFGVDESPEELIAAFGEITAAVSRPGRTTAHTETLAEIVWGACHGLATLEGSRRLRPGQHAERIDMLTRRISARSS